LKLFPAIAIAGALLVTDRAETGAVAVAVRQRENSEVFPFRSRAVAVMIWPALKGTSGELKVNGASPLPPADALVEPR